MRRHVPSGRTGAAARWRRHPTNACEAATKWSAPPPQSRGRQPPTRPIADYSGATPSTKRPPASQSTNTARSGRKSHDRPPPPPRRPEATMRAAEGGPARRSPAPSGRHNEREEGGDGGRRSSHSSSSERRRGALEERHYSPWDGPAGPTPHTPPGGAHNARRGHPSRRRHHPGRRHPRHRRPGEKFFSGASPSFGAAWLRAKRKKADGSRRGRER